MLGGFIAYTVSELISDLGVIECWLVFCSGICFGLRRCRVFFVLIETNRISKISVCEFV